MKVYRFVFTFVFLGALTEFVVVLDNSADDVFGSHAATGRNLLQAKKGLIFASLVV